MFARFIDACFDDFPAGKAGFRGDALPETEAGSGGSEAKAQPTVMAPPERAPISEALQTTRQFHDGGRSPGRRPEIHPARRYLMTRGDLGLGLVLWHVAIATLDVTTMFHYRLNCSVEST